MNNRLLLAEDLSFVEQSNPPERMADIARETARQRTHLVGPREYTGNWKNFESDFDQAIESFAVDE